MTTRSIIVLVVLAFVCARAEAHTVHYLGGHPVAVKYGGGYCLIEAPHLHVYPPDHPNLYQHVGDQVVFTADPTPFGYEGDKHPFYGHHPIATVDGEPVICYLDGPHFHPFAPPDGPGYEVKKGVAFYVGAFPPSYAKLRPARERAINAEYRPYVALRPTVEVAPPEHWQGQVWVAPPSVGFVAPGVRVDAPGVEVSAPVVEMRGPGVQVIAPGPPGVFVESPGVVVGGGIYVDDHRRGGEWHEDRGRHHGGGGWDHHDNGRHRGWGKHHE